MKIIGRVVNIESGKHAVGSSARVLVMVQYPDYDRLREMEFTVDKSYAYQYPIDGIVEIEIKP